MRKKILIIYSSLITAGVLYYILITFVGLEFPCLIYEVTGFKCAGCGITRMFLSLLNFRFAEAFLHNQVMFVLFFIWNIIAMLAFIGRPSFVRKSKFLYTMIYISVAFLTNFALARNFA